MQNDDTSGIYVAGKDSLSGKAAAHDLLTRYQNINRGNAEEVSGQPSPNGDNNTKKAAGVGFAATAGGVVKDIALGVVELPGSVLHGVIDAANETIDLADDFDRFMSEKFGNIVIGGKNGLVEIITPEQAKQGRGASELPNIPNIKEPDSVTGGIVEGVTQFLAGFLGAGKLKPIQAIKPSGTAGKIGKAALQGVVSDFSVFDPHEERLSNLVQDYPQLNNPVSEFLAASPSDSAAEGRLKNAIEGLGIGVAAEGFLKSVKMIRQASIAKRKQADLERINGGTEKVRTEISDDAFSILEPRQPNKTPDQAEKKGKSVKPSDIKPEDVVAKSTDPNVFINFSRIDTADDVKEVMQKLADSHKSEINNSRRGDKKTFQQMEMDANHVNAWETLQKRRQGEPLNAEQSIAARQLWASSAQKLQEVSILAAKTGSEADLFAFRKMLATHQTIQNEVIAARTETARALASWRIPAGSGAERFMEIDAALMQNGGKDLSREMAERVAALAKSGQIQELDKFVGLSAYAKTRNAMLEAWINGLLSGPKTHLVNAISNTSVVFQQMYERKTAEKIAQLLGDENSVQLGESVAQFSGLTSGFRDALRYAGKTFKTGESGFGLNKVELPTANSISSEALGISSSGFVGNAVDVLGASINLPTRGLAAADEFFKTIGYRMELNALALRKATKEVNSGLVSPENLKERIAEIIENPPSDVRLDAIDAATYQTFTNTPGQMAQLIQKAKGQYPVLNLILPFVRTPSNIMGYTFERTPLAPLFKDVRADLAAGGARRDIALARMSTGSMIMLFSADMAMNGEITGKGPSNKAERDALMRIGWQPYSIKSGDRYYAYNRLDPIGMTLGLSADMVDILANDEYGVEKQKTAEEVAVAIAMSVANNTMSKTYMSGLSDLVNAMSDPERYGESFFQRLSGSIVPTGAAEVARGVDPYMREANTMIEAMMKRTPGLSDNLPARRNLWGDPISYQSGLGVMYDGFSPIYSRSKKQSPIDEAIIKNEMNITMPPKKISIDGVSVDLERFRGAYSRYVELAGKDVIHPAWGLNSKELLDQIVSNKHPLSQVYNIKSDGPDGGKYFFVRDILEQYRDLAKRQLIDEYPEIGDEANDRKRKKLQLKMPVFGG